MIFFLCRKLKASGGVRIIITGFCLLLVPMYHYSQAHHHLELNKQINEIYKSSFPVNKKIDLLRKLEPGMQDCFTLRDSSFAYYLQKQAILYYNLKEYAMGAEKIRLSITLAKELINQSNTYSLLLDDYNVLYFLYRDDGKFERLPEIGDSCIYLALQYNEGYNIALDFLAIRLFNLFNKGEYNLCLRDAKLSVAIASRLPAEENFERIVNFITQQANVLNIFGDTSAALELLEFNRQQIVNEGHSNHTGPFDNLLALIYLENKNFNKALFYFKEGYKKSKLNNYPGGQCQSLGYIGAIYGKYLNRPDEGLRYCNAALRLAEASDSLPLFTDIATIYRKKNMFKKALYYFQRAFNSFTPGLSENNILTTDLSSPDFNMLQSLSDLLAAKADAYVQQYHKTKDGNFLKQAIDIYKKTDLFLSKIKLEQHLQFESNLAWRHSAHAIYEQAIEACYQYNDIDNAFYFFEKSRAVLLNDQINQRRSINETDLQQQTRLQKNIAQLEDSLRLYDKASAAYFNIQKKIYYEERKLEYLQANLPLKNTAGYNHGSDTSLITIKDVRNKLLDGAKSLVEIYAGDSAVYVLTVYNTKQLLLKINKTVYDSLVNNYMLLISNATLLNKHFKEYVNTAQALYKLIFQNGPPPYGSMIISPHGKTFPFEALITDGTTEQPAYLLNHYAVSYTYSAAYLINHPQTENTKISFLGMAPVAFSNFKLSSLNGSDASIMRIKENFGSSAIYTSSLATKNKFFSSFSQFSILQLYTHASDSSDRNNPVIYFADSTLYLNELLPNQKPLTRLVVLSACQTANGALHKGEGVFSFNRAFASLGIPAAISNLWNSNNDATYQITELFYQYLAQGLPSDAALQQAKITFIQQNNSTEKELPYFWACPVLMGKAEAFINESSKDSNTQWPMTLIIAALFSSGMFYFLYQLKNKKMRR